MLDIKELATELDDLRERDEEPEEGEKPDPLDDGERDRLEALIGLENDLGDLHIYSRNGEALIADRDFEDYARELHEDIEGRDKATGWPYDYIDWGRAAEALQADYTSIEFDGDTYWYRA
jgi:hypothetical protein